MRYLIDANIVLYGVNSDSPQHARARRFIDNQRRQATAWCTTWLIVYEFLRVATHRSVFAKPLSVRQAIAFIKPLIESESVLLLSETDQHLRELNSVVAEVPDLSGSVFHDVHTAVLMREHGVSEIITADQDFKRIPFLTVTNPVAD
jgi:uncharacterized protein